MRGRRHVALARRPAHMAPLLDYTDRLRRLRPYASAIALVALIGNFSTLHKAVRFTSRGRQ